MSQAFSTTRQMPTISPSTTRVMARMNDDRLTVDLLLWNGVLVELCPRDGEIVCRVSTNSPVGWMQSNWMPWNTIEGYLEATPHVTAMEDVRTSA